MSPPGNCVLQQVMGNWPGIRGEPGQTVGSFVTGGTFLPPPRGGPRDGLYEVYAILSKVKGPGADPGVGEEDFPRSGKSAALPKGGRGGHGLHPRPAEHQNEGRRAGDWEGPARTRKPWPLLALLRALAREARRAGLD